MNIMKRDHSEQEYCPEKIKNAVAKAFVSVGKAAEDEELDRILSQVERKFPAGWQQELKLSVEEIHYHQQEIK